MTQLFTNNAYGALASEASAAATTLILSAGSGMRFPLPSGGNDFLLTLIGLDGNGNESSWEIVKVTARATDTLTVVRAQEGTTAVTWPAGTRVELRVTAGTLASFTDAVEAAAAAPVQSVAGRTGHVTLTNADVGLANVENKSSATIRSELTSANVTTALGFTPENAANKGAANGYTPLGSDSKVPALYLPAYVDDVLEYANLAALPSTGVVGVIYVTLDTNKTYRWGGSSYTEISPSPGSTDSVTEGSVNLYFTNARAQAALAGMYLPSGGGSLAGNLDFSGTARRITGDLSSATVTNRLLVQSSTTNGATYFGLIPNGTAVNSQFHVYGASDPTNAPFGALLINASSVRVQSAALGSGTTLPLAFYVGTTEVARASTAYNFLVGTNSDDGTHKLQVSGALGVQGADAAVLSRIRAATGMMRVRPYMDATNGVMIDSTNAAENDYLPLTLQGSSIRLLGSSGGSVTVDASGNLTYTGNLTGSTGVLNIGSGQIYKDASGNVGIGTSSLSGRLTIFGATGDSNGIHLKTSGWPYTTRIGSNGTDGGTFYISQNWNAQSNTVDFSTYGTSAVSLDLGYIRFLTGDSNAAPATRVTIDNNGNIQNTVGKWIGNSAGASYLPDDGVIGGSIRNGGAFFITTGGTERMRIDSSGNVGIGTSSPGAKLHVNGGDIQLSAGSSLKYSANAYITPEDNVQGARISAPGIVSIWTGATPVERARIDSNGQVCIGCTGLDGDRPNVAGGTLKQTNGNTKIRVTSDSSGAFQFYSPTGGGAFVGLIQVNATSTSYITSSDYRLKENIQPMQNALATVAQLNPVTYTWKANGSDGQGFIAHELQAVVPDCVSGEKDAVDEDGKPIYQGVDTSFLVATLTAAIKELKAELDAVKAQLSSN